MGMELAVPSENTPKIQKKKEDHRAHLLVLDLGWASEQLKGRYTVEKLLLYAMQLIGIPRKANDDEDIAEIVKTHALALTNAVPIVVDLLRKDEHPLSEGKLNIALDAARLRVAPKLALGDEGVWTAENAERAAALLIPDDKRGEIVPARDAKLAAALERLNDMVSLHREHETHLWYGEYGPEKKRVKKEDIQRITDRANAAQVDCYWLMGPEHAMCSKTLKKAFVSHRSGFGPSQAQLTVPLRGKGGVQKEVQRFRDEKRIRDAGGRG